MYNKGVDKEEVMRVAESKYRSYRLDGDVIEVPFSYDSSTGMYFGEYPDFSETPRITPRGRRWVNAIGEGCQYADDAYGDCGSCPYFKPEQAGDLIGVCTHEKNRFQPHAQTLTETAAQAAMTDPCDQNRRNDL